MYFATAGGNSPDIPGLECGQNDISLWIPPSDECSSYPPLALTDGHYAGEIDPDLLCTKEEEESTLGSGKKKRKSGSPTREGTQIVKRRVKRSSFSEEERESGRRSQRVHRAPLRYIDEGWCKPKEKRKYKSRKAFMPPSKGLWLQMPTNNSIDKTRIYNKSNDHNSKNYLFFYSHKILQITLIL